ncbi:MAG TPA: stage V sporulation protein AC [Bacillales bacterium]|nr:stage V sporulation protein AC [Bacillales bacterium]
MAVKLNNPGNYKKNIKPYEPKPRYLRNCWRAFWTGGLICALGQAVSNFYIAFFDFTESTAGDPTVATLVLIASLLTGFGVYDKIGQYSGAGSLVPVTGFANSVTSAALEHRSEGLVLGVATNLFKLAGAVIVFGVVAAYIVGMIRYVFGMLIS